MSDGAHHPNDVFSRFWMDMVSKMAAQGMSPAASSPAEDSLKHIRQAYFDSWAKYCDEYLGSDQFLEVMRKSLDNALAFRQQVNEFLTKALHDGQMPSREDTDSIMLVLRSLEERVLDRFDRLDQRIDRLETRPAKEPRGAPGGSSGGKSSMKGTPS